MNLKTWLIRQRATCPTMERLLDIGRAYECAEVFFYHIIDGTDGEFQGKYVPVAKVMISKFKGQGGRFERPNWFKGIAPISNQWATVLPFVPRDRAVSEPTWEASWTGFYANLLGIDLGEAPADMAAARSSKGAEIIRLDRRSA